MNISFFFSQIAVSAASGIITLVGAWYFIRKDLQHYLQAKPPAAEKADGGQLLTLRLQAYERMIVFIDRLNPSNLFLRLNEPGISVHILHRLALHEIRTEFQHNVSQQLYLNAESWNVLCRLKEDTIAMINNAASTLPPEASGTDLSKKIVEHMIQLEQNPYELTVEMIKQDIHVLF